MCVEDDRGWGIVQDAKGSVLWLDNKLGDNFSESIDCPFILTAPGRAEYTIWRGGKYKRGGLGHKWNSHLSFKTYVVSSLIMLENKGTEMWMMSNEQPCDPLYICKQTSWKFSTPPLSAVNNLTTNKAPFVWKGHEYWPPDRQEE